MNRSDPQAGFCRALLALVLVGGCLPLAAAPPGDPAAPAGTAAATDATGLVEAFQKGPIAMTAKVVRAAKGAPEAALPLFQVPVLDYKDRLELSFAGEAFDPRVTSAEWSLIVVFLPRTVAPTDQGVVDLRLKRKDGRMVAPPIPAPYDSVPMIFLVPDKNGRKKILTDLTEHLAAFRSLCAKIADLSSQRASVDKFLEDLDAIDKNQSSAAYDNALVRFIHNYGDTMSGDLQTFLNSPTNNLDKAQFLTQEVRKTNILVPESAASGASSTAAAATVTVGTGGGRAVSAYVSIFFDLASIIHNLWPGHQFQYLPALARNFRDFSCELYYTDWVRTTGTTRGALMCCPGKWEDQAPPAFDIALGPGESLLRRQALLKVEPKDKDRLPFALFGHEWKLLLAGPRDQALPPLPLSPSPNNHSFVVTPGPALEALRHLGGTQVQARVVGRWGFTSFATAPVALPTGCDPAWAPSPAEIAGFRLGGPCAFQLPGAWAGAVEAVRFRPAAAGSAPLTAKLKEGKDEARIATFQPQAGQAGPGTLEIQVFGRPGPALARPLVLADAPPEPAGLEAHLGDPMVTLKGRHLGGVLGVRLGGRRFRPDGPGAPDGPARTFRAEDGRPLDGTPGHKLPASLDLAGGGSASLPPAALLPARPRLEEVTVAPVEDKGDGLPLTCATPIAPTSAPSQVSLLAARGYRFPADRAFRLALRNAEEPGEVRILPAAKVQVMGRNQKATFQFGPAQLLGGRDSGKLEIQVQDDHLGASDWLPLPPTFLDLPVVATASADALGFRLAGPSLDPIEAVAPAPGGPWTRITTGVEEGQEVAHLALPLAGRTCCLRLFGWPDLVLTLTFPPLAAAPVKPAPDPAPAKPPTPAQPPSPAKPPAPTPQPTPANPPTPAPPVPNPSPAPTRPEPAPSQPPPPKAPQREPPVPMPL